MGLLAPCPTPNLEGQASVCMTPGDRVAQLYPQAPGTHFSRLLRHAWVTVGLFLFPATTREETTIQQSYFTRKVYLPLLKNYIFCRFITLPLGQWRLLLCTGYCYGVVSYKASHKLRPFSDLRILLHHHMSSNHSWFIHQSHLAKISRYT
jgi:hypothetical protein